MRRSNYHLKLISAATHEKVLINLFMGVLGIAAPPKTRLAMTLHIWIDCFVVPLEQALLQGGKNTAFQKIHPGLCAMTTTLFIVIARSWLCDEEIPTSN